jgi:hypothetical protein
MVQAGDEPIQAQPALQPEELWLDPIRVAVHAFVGNVDASTKQMTAAADRFAQDYSKLIAIAGEARRRTAAEKAAVRQADPAVENLQRSAQAASQAAAEARDAAAGAAGLPAVISQPLEPDETNRRLVRLEEDIGVLTALMREMFNRMQQPAQLAAPEPPPRKSDVKISRRYRMRVAREVRQTMRSEQTQKRYTA